ncbi:ATP-binding protein [Nonomuraea sp. NPDC059007]|uniref:ATP-binding protein n=1 Tax=Nonomuraea sp. NPDC059007 TaxID=3346692 RepID=UPI0036893EB3
MSVEENLPTEPDADEPDEASEDRQTGEPGGNAPPELDISEPEIDSGDIVAAESSLTRSLVTLGFVAFDGQGTDNTSTGVMVSEQLRRHFRRDAYVGITDTEQGITFLGRVVEGPFHSPHEIGPDSAISRTTLLHPDRTQFRPTYYASGTIEILGEVTDAEVVLPTSTRPRPYSQAFIYPSDRLRRMLGLEGDMQLGTLLGYDGVRVEADSTNKGFLPRNIGIFGTVGSGKSNTTQVLMEEAIRAGWAVVAIDVEGEYVRMDQGNDEPHLAFLLEKRFGERLPRGLPDCRVYVPNAGMTDAPRPVFFKVPISDVPEEIVADILELSEAQVRMWGAITAQARRDAAKASRPSKMGSLGPATTPPARPYTLSTLIDGVQEDPAGAIPLLTGKIGVPEKNTASTLRNKLFKLGRSDMLDWNPTQNTPYLNVDDLLAPGRLSVFDVSETNDTARNIAISFLLQALFDRVIAVPRGQPLGPGLPPRPPVLVVIEEVHTFVSRASAGRMRAVLDQLQVISRRGRKRWMGLALVSQQPGHVPEELFELANTRFIHQLKSAGNLAPVRATTGGVHEALWATVPALGQGQCLLTGSMFRNPVFVQMRPARSRRMHTA